MTENTIIEWKRLWQLVSGIQHETPESTVLDELLNVTKELQDGLLQYRTSCASKTQMEQLLKDKKQEKLMLFTIRLQELLDLESVQCWEMLCYYFSNEYRGSANTLKTIISTETNMNALLDDIWSYYTLQRMVVLKIVKNLLVFFTVPHHPYQRQYKEIIERITLPKLRDSYLKQLDYLIKETPSNRLLAGECFNFKAKLVMWSERNAREINEVLHILLLIYEQLPVRMEDVKQLFACCRLHAFGRQQNHLDAATNNIHAELLARLAHSQLVLLLKCIDLGDAQISLANEIIGVLDKDVALMHQHPEHGPLLLGWMLLHMRCSLTAGGGSKDEDSLHHARLFGKRAISLNCFEYMHKLLSSDMFQDDSQVSRIARQTIYNMLGYMCDCFDGDGSCARHRYVYELLGELLSWPMLAKDFCDQEDGGVRSLYNTLLEGFPLDFAPLSLLAHALTKAGMGSYIKGQLESLPIFTDVYDESKYPLRAVAGSHDATAVDDDLEYVLVKSANPYPRIAFTLPAGTRAALRSRPTLGYCVHFKLVSANSIANNSNNYFLALHNEINGLLGESVMHEERVRRVNAGLRFLEATLQRTKSLSGISDEMVHPTELCVDLLNKFKSVQQPPIQLLANCLNVCTALLPLADAEIFQRVVQLCMLPVITNAELGDYKRYAHGVCFDFQLMGGYLVDVEKKLQRYDFLMAYLAFLRSYTKLQRHYYFQVEIPGLVFLLREVFPHMHAWHFCRQSDKNRIYAETMGFICDILDSANVADDKADANRQSLTIGESEAHTQKRVLLRDICVYSLLNMENGLMLLRFVALGNSYLQHSMELECNWMLQQTQGPTLLVRLAMRILMQLLRLKGSICCGIGGESHVSPLEALIYTQPKQHDTLRIIPVVTSYMSNIFDRWLPILACRLLKRIALGFNMSLLACLDMEPDQIRLTFLQKLPDAFENDSLKIAILELVEACITRQPGVTEAFFKAASELPKKHRLFEPPTSNKHIADSILTYIEDFIEAVGVDAHAIEQPLPTKMMNLLHSLWKQNMQLLIDSLVKKPGFWDKLCKPLFHPLRPHARAYTQLLNMLAIEIYCSAHKPQHADALRPVVLRFFEPTLFARWVDFVFDMPLAPAAMGHEVLSGELPEWLCRLQAFKSFIVIVIRKQPPFIVDLPQQRQFRALADKCLAVLVRRASYVDDLRPFIVLCELYLHLLLALGHGCVGTAAEGLAMLQQLCQLLSAVATNYSGMHVRAKEACLAITIKSAELLSEHLRDDISLALDFLHAVVSIGCAELQCLEQHIKTITESCALPASSAVALSLNLLKTVATIFHNDGPGSWDLPFIVNKVFQRLLSCTSSLLQQCGQRMRLSAELLDVLLVFAKGSCSAEFLHCDVGNLLWLKLLPPKQLLQSHASSSESHGGDETWTVQRWWPIYTCGIDLVTVLLQQHKQHFLREALQFVGIHEEYLMDALQLGKQSLEPLAVNLIKSTVTLLSELVVYEQQWRLEHSQSLFNLMSSVQILMSHSISMYHQPKNLKCLISGRRSQIDILRDSDNTALVQEAIATFNELSEIIIVCIKCLQRFSPQLIDLICDPEFLACKYEPLFQIHFGAPKMAEHAVALTFGTVLSIVSIYTKVLNLQNYGFHDVPLNVLPSDDEANTANDNTHAVQPSTSATTTRLNTAPSASKRTFAKSISVNSVASASCPPNELLAHLDGELCLMALEHILALAASQSMLALKNTRLQPREKQLIRREISSELLTYHEFVRKKVLVEYREHRGIWHRRHHGQVYMRRPGADGYAIGHRSGSSAHSQIVSVSDVQRRHSTELRNSMRVNVVRRLHLQQHPAVSSTPIAMHEEQLNYAPHEDIDAMDNEEATAGEHEDDHGETIVHFPVEEIKYSPLSYVQLVEEDYLHFMSNLFMLICQHD